MKKDNIYFQLLKCSFGLFVYSFGLYMTIIAQIGLAPWDVLAMGISYNTNMTYGNALVLSGIAVLIVVCIMKEKIGFGTIFDALFVGVFVDVFTMLKIVKTPSSVLVGVGIFIVGMLIMALGQYFYMGSGQGCGPRDTLLIGLGKRFKKLPIGVVNTMILCVVFVAGIALGGPIGIGTILATFGMGMALQLVCKLLHFEPRDIIHKNLFEAIAIMCGNR